MLKAILFSFVLGFATTLSAQVDPGAADSVRIDSLVTFGTGERVLPVYFRNDENLAAVEVTLRETSSAIVVDSISFVGSRLETIGLRGWSQDSGTGTITLYAFATLDLILPGNGLMANVHLRILDDTPRSIGIDTGSFQDGPLLRTTSFTADGSANPFIPQFRKGWVTITAAPQSFDSVAVDSVFTLRGTHVSLPVSLFNETDLKKVNVALLYGSSEIQFDSVSFAGGRVATATNTVSHNDATNSLLISSTLSDLDPLTPGTGTLCWLHFTIPSNATPGSVLVDSTTYFGLFGTLLTKTGAGGDFTPLFHAGKIHIDAATDVADDLALPESFSLDQNYPNPFNPTTEIVYALPERSTVRLEIFDVLGREVAVLVHADQEAGEYRVTVDAASMGGKMGSGVYFYRLTADNQSAVRKMILLK